MILFNTAGVDSFDRLTGFVRVSTPKQLKEVVLAAWPDGPMRVIYVPRSGDREKHFECVSAIVKACKRCVFAVDEIDAFMSANNPGCPAFYDLTNYGRHLRIALVGTTRNTVAVSRQFTSMLTEMCIFATTEPRYLRYLEDTCGGQVSDQVPLLGKYEYIRWMADGSECVKRRGWGNRR